MLGILLVLAVQVSDVSSVDGGAPAEMVSTTVEAPAVVDVEVSGDLAEVPAMVLVLKQAYDNNDQRGMAAGFLMLLMWFLRGLLARGGKEITKLMPWITVGMAVGTGGLLAIEAGLPLRECIVVGALIGLASIGAWETGGKLSRDALKKLFQFGKALSPSIVRVASLAIPKGKAKEVAQESTQEKDPK